MTKTFVDQLIKNMKSAGIVTKATPWLVEGFGEKQMNVRYIGIQLNTDWQEVFSAENNLLLKFVIDKQQASLEYYLANKPPFVKIITHTFSSADKWETLLGELKRRLKKDKADFLSHRDDITNVFARLKPHLK
jgi:hypothetical protein